MKPILLAIGVLAWVGVGALAVAMASLDEPVLGFFPIAAAVVGAWLIGVYITDVAWQKENDEVQR